VCPESDNGFGESILFGIMNMRIIVLLMLALPAVSCQESKSINQIELNCVKEDGSFDYSYLYRKEIRTQRERETIPVRDYFRK
jgi:hypothetical protein